MKILQKPTNSPLAIFALTCTELATELTHRYNKSVFHTNALYREVFKNGNCRFTTAPAFTSSPTLASQLAADVIFPVGTVISIQKSSVTKFALQLYDNAIIETVIIPSRNRTTLCCSSQVGCRMGCTFCETGAQGFIRNLAAEEIVLQVFTALFTFKQNITNIVFMGMGEPLDNFEQVMQAIHVISDPQGLNIAHRHITISTAGDVAGIRRLASANTPRLRLAVSLHAAENSVRSMIMPINRHYPIDMLKAALLAFPLEKKGVFFIEYVLIPGVNDSWEMAKKVALFLADLPVKVNLIPCNNTVAGDNPIPSAAAVEQFRDWLVAERLFVRIRQSHGAEIGAACGQLRSTLTAPSLVYPPDNSN